MCSRTFRFDPGAPVPDEVRRVARGRIDHALDELRGESDSTREEAVHEARKDMKKLRAVVRLVRAEIGDNVYRRENACFRDAGQELSGVRDADVMLATLAKLEQEIPEAAAGDLRQALEAHKLRTAAGTREQASVQVVEILATARRRIGRWPLDEDGFEAVAGGLQRIYRRGRKDFRSARAEPTTENLHEWRKRVKDLWYHHTLLRPLWPPVMEAVGDQAHELADRLGDDHDLAVLADWIREHTETGPEFFDAVDRRRAELQAEAMTLGARLYAEKPKAYVRRLRRLSKASPAFVRAP